MIRKRFFPVLAVVMIGLLFENASAQDVPEDATIVRGPFSLNSSIGLDIVHDDNVFRAATDERGATITLVKPELGLQFAPGSHVLSLDYAGELGRYSSLTSDDYDDHRIEGSAALRLGRRSELEFSSSLKELHENRGTGLTEGTPVGELPVEPDRYSDTAVSARYTYGLSDDGASISLSLGETNTDYDNNLERTRYFARSVSSTGLSFGVPVKGATRIVFEVGMDDVAYDHVRPGRSSVDSTEQEYLIGVEWDASAKTTGSIKAGHLEKDFDALDVPSFSSPTWEMSVRWSPRSYSHLEFGTRRTAEESNSLSGDARDITEDSVSWIHSWNDRLQTTVAMALLHEDYQGTGDLRKQDTGRYSLDLSYEIQSWLQWEIGLARNTRSSDIDRFDFAGNIVRTGVVVTF
jgi:hypothetical protein